MKVFKTFLTVLLFSAALPVAFGASIKSDYQKDFDFSRLHTFSFKTERDSGDRLATNTIEAQRIQKALTAQLEESGFTQASDNPDFIVAFYSRVKEKTEINSTGFGYGPAWGWGYGIPNRARWRWGLGPDIWTHTYTQGCVMADIIDTKTQELVWRGVVKDTEGDYWFEGSPDAGSIHYDGIGQSEKQTNSAAKDLVQRFLKDTRSAEKQKARNQAR
jgi:hypothetical protein